MRDTLPEDRAPHVSSQVAATILSEERAAHQAATDSELSEIRDACESARAEFEKHVHDFIDNPDTPGPRGSLSTQHGEIAEKLTVAEINALDIMEGRSPTATFDGVGGKGPTDYIVDDMPIQSKYGKSAYDSLDLVIEHLKQYESAGIPNTHVYHIPANQHDELSSLLAGDTNEGWTHRDVDAVRRQLEEIRNLTGRNPQDVIQPGKGTYDEVQPDQIRDTVKDREQTIDELAEGRENQALLDHAPSAAELAQAGAFGGAVGAGVGIGEAILAKWREGKNPFRGEFTKEDWADVGVSGSTGSGRGVVGGSALYLLTNATNLAAPFAGSLVTATMTISNLRRSLRAGHIDDDQFRDYCQIVASEAAIVGLAAAAGQAMIPVPILGAFVGSIAGKIVATTLKGRFEKDAADLASKFGDYERWAMAQLDEEWRRFMAQIDQHFMEMDRLEKLAFDPDTNTELRLRSSATLARRMNVPDEFVLDSTDEVDAFITE